MAQLVPTDSQNEKQHRTVIAVQLNELIKFYNTIGSGTWTATIRGSGTAGTYEIASQNCRYSRIGRRVWLDIDITMAAALTAGGTGYMQITGAPYTKIADSSPIGSAFSAGLDFSTAGAFLTLNFITSGATTTLFLRECSDNAAAGDFQISGLAANDIIRAAISYETDDL